MFNWLNANSVAIKSDFVPNDLWTIATLGNCNGHYLNFPGLRFRQLPLVTAFPPFTGHS